VILGMRPLLAIEIFIDMDVYLFVKVKDNFKIKTTFGHSVGIFLLLFGGWLMVSNYLKLRRCFQHD